MFPYTHWQALVPITARRRLCSQGPWCTGRNVPKASTHWSLLPKPWEGKCCRLALGPWSLPVGQRSQLVQCRWVCYLVRQIEIFPQLSYLFLTATERLLVSLSNYYLIFQLKHLSAAIEKNQLGLEETFPYPLLSPGCVDHELISMQRPGETAFYCR